MTRNRKQKAADAKPTFGAELVASAHEALAIAKGEVEPARAYVPEKVDVPAIRAKSKLSQAAFAERYGIPVGTLRDWEQDRRQPDQTARVLLAVIARDPKAVERALRPVQNTVRAK
jgi:putative transcriptional regulator